MLPRIQVQTFIYETAHILEQSSGSVYSCMHYVIRGYIHYNMMRVYVNLWSNFAILKLDIEKHALSFRFQDELSYEIRTFHGNSCCLMAA